MTREDAIIILECITPNSSMGCGASDEEIEDAIDMAIKALGKERCEDCISRQEVLDIIDFEDGWLYDAKSHNADTKIAFSGLKSKVKDLPSVVPKTESEV